MGIISPRVIVAATGAIRTTRGATMDDRQTQIRERAGLEESRLNVEFIEWLRKWGSPLLLVGALAAAGWALKDKYARGKAEKLDRAFLELESAREGESPSPDALLAVASEYQDQGAVATLARLEAADAYLDAVRRGIRLGAAFKRGANGQLTGELENAGDVLSAEDKANYLTRAGELYQQVADANALSGSTLLTSLNAQYGLAAVAEGKGEYARAREVYEKIARSTTGTAFEPHAAVANRRITRLDGLAKQPALLPRAAMPKKPEPPAPVVNPVASPGAAPGAGPTIEVTPVSAPQPAPPEMAPAAPKASEPGVPPDSPKAPEQPKPGEPVKPGEAPR